MDTDPRYPGGIRSAGPSSADPEPDAPDADSDWPDGVDDPPEPDPTWKHPDDGKDLSDRDQERPLKP